MPAQPIPEDYPRVIPYLNVDGAAAAIAFYVEVLGAKERMRMPGPDGTVGHAELTIGDSMVMLADSSPEMGNPSPRTVGGTPVTVMVYVEDVNAVIAAALAKGATTVRPIENQFYGDRSGSFEDPFGHHWHIATHIEDVSPEEMGRRMQAMLGEGG
jgi:PhnB protein